MQQDEPSDFVVGTGQSHTVRQMVEIAFQHAGLDWERFVRIDPGLLRPAEVDRLVADPSRARKVLGWNYETSFERLVQMMVDAELERLASSPSPGERS